jgi:AraC family transcriptional regulator
MDDLSLSCGRADASVGIVIAMQSGDAQGGDLARVAHLAETRDQLLSKKLLTVVSELIETMADALSLDDETARECVHHASAALLSCAGNAYDSGGVALAEPKAGHSYRGGLAPWQVRSVTTYIDVNLNTSLSCEMLARLTRLSLSHFARAFKCTFGCSPHVFLMRRRIERAQGLMLKTNVPLAQIASECGLADQAHLSRLFLRFTGETPASWRRARTSGAA